MSANNEMVTNANSLKWIAEQEFTDPLIWFGLLEDQLKRVLPENSAILAQFLKAKDAAGGDAKDAVAVAQIKADCKKIAESVARFLESQSSLQAPDTLQDEVERIIQKGYFNSVYFRAVVGGLGLVLVLITGVGTFKVHEQVQQMQKLLDDARANVEKSNIEIAKAKADTSSKQAELALLILEGNEQMVRLRTSALTEMSAAETAFKTDVDAKTKQWTDEVDKVGPGSVQQVRKAGDAGEQGVKDKAKESRDQIDSDLRDSRKSLKDKLGQTLTQLEAAKNPWVPRVLWSFSATWLFAPLAVLVSLIAWLNSIASSFRSNNSLSKVVTVAGIVVVVVIVAFVARQLAALQ